MAVDVPITSGGLLALIAVVLLSIVIIYASSMLTVLFGAVLIAALLYGLYVVGWRFDDWLKNGR